MPVLHSLRSLLVSIRNAVDGRRHPARRTRANARLETLSPRSVLFVCLGNICRSPYAACVLGARSHGRIEADSVGFIGPGRAPPDEALTVARARGIDHSGHLSKTVLAEHLAQADAVFIFDRFNAQKLSRTPGARMDRVFWLGDFDPEWTGRRAILDPWGKPVEEFAATFEQIDRCLDAVLATLDAGASPNEAP